MMSILERQKSCSSKAACLSRLCINRFISSGQCFAESQGWGRVGSFAPQCGSMQPRDNNKVSISFLRYGRLPVAYTDLSSVLEMEKGNEYNPPRGSIYQRLRGPVRVIYAVALLYICFQLDAFDFTWFHNRLSLDSVAPATESITEGQDDFSWTKVTFLLYNFDVLLTINSRSLLQLISTTHHALASTNVLV